MLVRRRADCAALTPPLAAALTAALAAVLLGWPLAASHARAQTGEDPAPLGFEVQAGFGAGTDSPWVPLEVTLHPTRLVAGVLAVDARTPGGPVREERSIEVSAASRKVFRFLAPAGAISVSVHEPGAEPVTLNVRSGGDEGGRFLVGALGEVPLDAPGVRHEAVDATGQWVSVDPAWAELSGFALQPLGTLVAELEALGGLTAQGQRNVAAAVAAGTDLVVVVDSAGPIDLGTVGLPWSPARAAIESGDLVALVPEPTSRWLRARDVVDGGSQDVIAAAQTAGHGRVTVVSATPGQGALGRSSELWSELVSPSPRAEAPASEQAVDRHPFQAARLVQEPGAGVPTLPWLAAFIVAYVLIVGPVNGVVLARLRRRELSWVTIPAVTVVFTAGAFAGAVGGKAPTHLAGSVSYWVDGTAVETVAVNVRAPRPGRHRIELLGSGWTIRPLRSGTEPSVVRVGESAAVDMRLEALQPGVVLGWRTVERATPMDVRAVATDAGLQVTVRNVAGRGLDHVRVRTATTSVLLGALGPGQETTVEVAEQRLRGLDPWVDPFSDLPAGPEGIPEAPRSLEALLRTEMIDGNPGLVWAIGVAGDGTGDAVRVDGRPPIDKGSLVAVGAAPVVPDGAAAPRHAVARDLLAARGDALRHQLAIEAATEAFLRFRFPPGERRVLLAQDLVAQDFGGAVTLDVWSVAQRQWIPLADAFPAADLGDPQQLLTPLGELYVRASGELWPFDYSTRSVFEIAQEPREERGEGT